MDKTLKLLENLIVSRHQLPIGYRKISPNLRLVDEVINLSSPLVNPTLPLESETHTSHIDQPLVDEVVDSIPSFVDHSLPLEIEVNIIEVLLVT